MKRELKAVTAGGMESQE